LFSFRGYAEPTLVINASSIGNAIYNTSFLYEFSSVWDSNVTGNENIIICNFTLGRPDGTFNNYSFSPNSTTSPSLCYKSFTQDDLGQAGNYNWTWEVENDTDWTSTNLLYNFTIGKALPSISLLLNGNANNITLDRYMILNSTAQTTPPLTVNISSNMSDWNEPSSNTIVYNTTNLTQLGIFNVTAYTLGNANYTANNQTYYINVSEIAPTYSNPLTSDSTYSPNKQYQFNITWQDGSLGNVTFNIYNTSLLSGNPINLTFNSILNSTNLVNYTIDNNTKTFSVNVSDLPAGSYNYVWTAFDTFGLNSSSTNSYVVSPNQTVFTIFTALSDWTIYTSQSMTITCTASNPVTVNIYIGGTKVTNDPVGSASYSYSSSSPASGVSCVCSATTTNANYTGNSFTNTINVQATTTTTTTTSSGSSTSTGTFTIKGLTSALTAMTGQSTSTSFTVSNNLQNNLANVSISVSGIDSSWYSLSKFNSTIGHGATQPITITFNIPDSAEVKDYSVTITAAGKDILTKLLKTYTATMKLTVNSSQPQPIQPLPSVTETPQLETVQENNTENITSNQTSSVATGLAPAFEFFKDNLVIILAVAACLLIFMFRNNLTTALGGTLGKEEPETHKAKSASPLKGIKDKLNYKIVVNLKKESKAKDLKETAEVQGAEKIPEMVPEKQPKRPAMLEKEIKRDINELQSILEAEKKVGKNKKKFDMKNN
jgi:hypothetical protein